jgi:hypothetical protein
VRSLRECSIIAEENDNFHASCVPLSHVLLADSLCQRASHFST